jgi:hypothetical protein
MTLKDGTFFTPTQDQMDFWGMEFPNVPTYEELRSMSAWCVANVNKRKTKRGILRFINGWLTKEQKEVLAKEAAAIWQTGKKQDFSGLITRID